MEARAAEPELQSFTELSESVGALLEACLQFGGELVQAVPPTGEEDSGAEEASADLQLVDKALTAYFSTAYDLKRRNSQTDFTVAIIALAKSG